MEDDNDGCYRKAVDLLARRPHFRAELERKLRDRSFAPDTIEGAIERLLAQGYLDDDGLAREFVQQRLRRAPEGPRKLRARLLRRGVESSIIDATLQETFVDGDLNLARDAADRWRRRHSPDSAALARHLDRKGFSKATIVQIVESEA